MIAIADRHKGVNAKRQLAAGVIGESQTVLIVDDDLTCRTWLSGIMEANGFHAVTAPDGPAGVRLTEELRPAAMILDIRMPGLDGIGVSRILRSENPTATIPILFLTSAADVGTRIEAFGAGVCQFASKPVDAGEILSRLRALMMEAQLHNLAAVRRLAREKEAHLNGTDYRLAQIEISRNLRCVAELWGNHVEAPIARVGRYAGCVARTYGVGNGEVDLIQHAVALRDIGIVAVPDDVLLKPSALTDDERRTAQMHTAVGHLILSTTPASDLMTMAADIALAHHERWDGSGYPRKLEGKRISLPARIAAVTDVFDALTSDRPYRPAWPVNEAIGEIIDGRGTQFDPEVVDSFVCALPEILPIAAGRMDSI